VYSKDELEALAAVFRQHPQIMVISDEIYEYINYAGHHTSMAQIDGMKDRVLLINGMSKAYAMTGWRLGYMAGPREIIQACERLQGQCTSGANSITQKAAVTALLSDLAPTNKMVDAFKQRRDYVIGALRKMPGVKSNNPDGAFYAFPDISSFFGKSHGDHKIANDSDMSMYLLHEAHVSTVCGSAFGDGNCIRISFATSMTNLMEAMERMTTALAKLA